MGEHTHDCECGCHDMAELEGQTITLTLDDGSEIECIIICRFEIREQEYIALLPTDSEDGDVYLYRYSETKEGEPVLDNIEDDDEYEEVTELFDELLDEILDDEEFEEEASEETEE